MSAICVLSHLFLFQAHTHIHHKEESHVANIRTFHISGTYTLFSYLLSRVNWHNDLEILDVSPLVLLLEM